LAVAGLTAIGIYLVFDFRVVVNLYNLDDRLFLSSLN